MPINQDFRTAAALSGVARGALDAFNNRFILPQWLPNRENTTLNYAFDASGTTLVDVASYRAFDTEAPYGRLGPTITKEGKLPPISRKMPVSEFYELQFTNNLNALGSRLEALAESLGAGIAARLELARIEAVLTGQLNLSENGLTAQINFARDAALTVPLLAAASQWDQATALPIDNLIAWRELVKEKSKGTLPSAMILSNSVLMALMANPQIVEYAIGRDNNLPSRVSADEVRAVISGYTGITTVIVAEDSYSGAYDFGQQVWPVDKIVLLPPAGVAIGGSGSLGTTDLGIPAEALQPSYGIPETERPGIFCGAFTRTDPEGLDVLASAIALPLLQKANATLGATVVAAS